MLQVQSKKPLLPERRPASKRGRMPPPPSLDGGSAHRSRRLDPTCPQAFGGFLDFLTEGQILDSLQLVVEQATERMAAMKTNTGVPLVEVQDPVEAPTPVQRPRTRPSFSTVHKHRAQPTLCTGYLNNYPSCSSSVSDSRNSLKAGWLGFRDGDLDGQGLGSLPPVKDKLLLEKSLKRLQRLENKGRCMNQRYSQRDSLLWNPPTHSQWRGQPLPWFSELLGSRADTSGASDMGSESPKREFKKEMKSLLSQPASFDLPVYCPIREPHHTLDFLAKHHLFPALQSVVSQAVEKLSSAHCHNGIPLFHGNLEPSPRLPVTSLLQADSKMAVPTNKEEVDSFPTRTSSPKTPQRKIKTRRVSPVSPAHQMVSRFRPKVTPTEEPNSTSSRFLKKKPLPSISSEPSIANPWQEELTDLLTEQAVSLLIYKYKFEDSLNKQLGFISFPVTETFMDILLGFKKVKDSHICLSSNIDWKCLLRKLEATELEQQALRQASKQSSKQASKQSSKQTSKQASKQTSKQTSKQASKQVSKQASQITADLPDTSDVTTQQETTASSPESMHLLAPGTESQEQVDSESHLSLHEFPIFQLLSPRGSAEAEEHLPINLSELNASEFSFISMDSNVPRSQEVVNIEDSKDSEEQKNKIEDKEEGAPEDENEFHSRPEHSLAALSDTDQYLGYESQ
ncbi:PREDICTED: coiled-coil domain-containing protein 116 [Dipodomys ordii]|uniref:Coiled-coil domain-containing protein 116 n=1 Tax=Dipodomys ordii TaxID=10020 RepID=A0A1S3GDR8_DIPOR|nr:PREDICTED: coiled-coil domain-containing protein 116 [Dipodomys ordii]